MRPAIRWSICFISVVLSAPASVANAAVGAPTHIKDYVQNNPYGKIVSRRTTQSDDGKQRVQTTVNYMAFNGSEHTLEELEGVFSRILYPAVWPAPEKGLTDDQLEEMIDQLDMLWVLFSQILGQETGGTGKLIVAFLPETCTHIPPPFVAAGCGSQGARGVELSYHSGGQDTSLAMELLRDALDSGRPTDIIIHEMAHNYDLYWQFFGYLSDHSHAWVDFIEPFVQNAHGQIGSFSNRPEELYRARVDQQRQSYLDNPANDWASCVQAESCSEAGVEANAVWASIYHLVYDLYGINAILGSFQWMNTHIASNGLPPTTEAKESLRNSSLAHGAGVSLACLLRAMRFPVDPAAENQWIAMYGAGNTDCDDADQDGFSIVEGDCNDADATVNPAADEFPGNAEDDDCNQFIDEAVIDEAQVGELANPFSQSTDILSENPPFILRGEIIDSDEQDSIEFPVSAYNRFLVRLCSTDNFEGFASPLTQENDFLDPVILSTFVRAGKCSTQGYKNNAAPIGRLWMTDNDSPGTYEVAVTITEDWPLDRSHGITVTSQQAGGMQLHFTDINDALAAGGTTEVDAWISGHGLLDSSELTASRLERATGAKTEVVTTFDITAQTVPSLVDGNLYKARIQARQGQKIIERFSGEHVFRYDATPRALPTVGHGYSGSWYDPSHNGEGFIIEVLSDDLVVVYWFTYRFDGTQRWMFAVGEINGNRVVFNDMLQTRGGEFGPDFDPATVEKFSVGSLSITFFDCATAIANYSIDGVGGHQELTRLTNLFGHSCTSPEDPPPALDLNGSWFDPSHDGEGYLLEMLAGNQVVIYWFTYDKRGNQAWIAGLGSISGNTVTITDMRRFAGPSFGRSFDPAVGTNSSWGSLTLVLSCSGGSASYTTTDEDFSNGSQSVVILAKLAKSGC